MSTRQKTSQIITGIIGLFFLISCSSLVTLTDGTKKSPVPVNVQKTQTFVEILSSSVPSVVIPTVSPSSVQTTPPSIISLIPSIPSIPSNSPSIDELNPSSGSSDAYCTIKGKNFGENMGRVIFTRRNSALAEEAARVIFWAMDRIVIQPPSIDSFTYDVSIETTNKAKSNAKEFVLVSVSLGGGGSGGGGGGVTQQIIILPPDPDDPLVDPTSPAITSFDSASCFINKGNSGVIIINGANFITTPYGSSVCQITERNGTAVNLPTNLITTYNSSSQLIVYLFSSETNKAGKIKLRIKNRFNAQDYFSSSKSFPIVGALPNTINIAGANLRKIVVNSNASPLAFVTDSVSNNLHVLSTEEGGNYNNYTEKSTIDMGNPTNSIALLDNDKLIVGTQNTNDIYIVQPAIPTVSLITNSFYYPNGVAVDSANNVYVADSNNYRIQKFTSTGTFITKWGACCSDDGQFNQPNGVAVDSANNVYVSDQYNYRIQKFDSNGTFITKWGTNGSGDGQFNQPNGVAVDSANNVYVADRHNYRIQKFDSNGIFITKWGAGYGGDGQFNQPNGVAVDSANNVYVSDQYNYRIQKFTSTGTLIGWFGKDNTGATGWHDPGSGRVGNPGSGDGQFNQTNDVAVDSANNVYVADLYNHRIQKFTDTGTFITKWGTNGSGDGQFNQPNRIAVDSANNVYVADSNNYRIQKFDSNGTFTTKWDGLPNYSFYIAVNTNQTKALVSYFQNFPNKFSLIDLSPPYTVKSVNIDNAYSRAGLFNDVNNIILSNINSPVLTFYNILTEEKIDMDAGYIGDMCFDSQNNYVIVGSGSSSDGTWPYDKLSLKVINVASKEIIKDIPITDALGYLISLDFEPSTNRVLINWYAEGVTGYISLVDLDKEEIITSISNSNFRGDIVFIQEQDRALFSLDSDYGYAPSVYIIQLPPKF